MAQAARLNLRMQKELKLLLTDPPPGASFPSLSDDSYASSLTSIDALLQGPEGTAYANGVFKIKIQIPERYPFQPPVVTFTTPIYHPNIDNGGRICLDVLNLPPKGMWQPSLNISTVLTSIGLLLSEPNPDDGLMHEASRDYKYNRQAFDQNARSMTEKYARPGETESARGSYGTGGSTENAKMEGSGASMSTTECRKQSLDTLGSCSNEGANGKEIYNVSHDNSKNNTEFGPPLKEPLKCTGNLGKLQATRTKLSLKVSVASPSRNYGSEETTSPPNHCSLMQVNQLHGVGTYQSKSDNEKLHGLDATKPQEGLACSISTDYHKTNAHKDAIDSKGNCAVSAKLKKIVSVGQNHLIEEKENLASVQCLAYQSAASTNMASAVSENGMYCNKSVKHGLRLKHLDLKNDIAPDQKQQKINQVCVRESSSDKLKQVGDIEGSHVAEAVIVLDSEESEDEIAAVRSKLSLAKRCLSRKRKSASGS